MSFLSPTCEGSLPQDRLLVRRSLRPACANLPLRTQISHGVDSWGLGPAESRGAGLPSSLDPFQERLLVVTYLMFGTLQRKVLFDEYATWHQREVQMVRTAAGVASGRPAGQRT